MVVGEVGADEDGWYGKQVDDGPGRFVKVDGEYRVVQDCYGAGDEDGDAVDLV